MSNLRITLYVCAYKVLHTSNGAIETTGFVALRKDIEGLWQGSAESKYATLTGTRLRQLCFDSYQHGGEPVSLHLSPPLDIEFQGGSKTITVYRALEPEEREGFLVGFSGAL